LAFGFNTYPMSEDVVAVLGRTNGDHVAVRPLNRNDPNATDFWDGNWLTCEIEVRAGVFRGRVRTSLRTEDIPPFRAQLAALHTTLRGEARLRTMEDWLSIDAHGDGLGHIEFECELRDASETGNALRFHLSLDQTDLQCEAWN
jgi:hypothetical protein